MKIQFSIAGVLLLTTFAAVTTALYLQPRSLPGQLDFAAVVPGGMIGWIVGVSYRRKWQGVVGGVLGGLLFCCLGICSDPHYWRNPRAFEAIPLLMLLAVIGAVPVASVTVVIRRPARDLIIWPIVNCLVVATVPTVPLAVGMMVAGLANRPDLFSAAFVALVIAYYFVLLLFALSLAAGLGCVCGALALAARELLHWIHSLVGRIRPKPQADSRES